MNDKQTDRADQDGLPQELVAYLDGELDAAESRKIEQRLAEDSEFRQRLHQHQQTWDMLDELPKTRAGDRFTQTTLEMVVVSASQAAHTHLPRELRRRMFWVGGGLGVAAAILAGYLAVATVASAPNRRLVQDLPVIEELDAYRHAESVEFLRALADHGLFAVEDAEDAL